LQMQSVLAMLALGESEFVGQASQSPCPIKLFHFPAAHAVQGPPSGPDQPALQAQLLKAVLC
jgi:hypothetical protein